jgi:hypothetical protein
MNERRDDWAQAFGESVGIVPIGFRLLGITQDDAARFRSAKRSLGPGVEYKGSDTFAIKVTGQGPTAPSTSVITVHATIK